MLTTTKDFKFLIKLFEVPQNVEIKFNITVDAEGQLIIKPEDETLTIVEVSEVTDPNYAPKEAWEKLCEFSAQLTSTNETEEDDTWKYFYGIDDANTICIVPECASTSFVSAVTGASLELANENKEIVTEQVENCTDALNEFAVNISKNAEQAADFVKCFEEKNIDTTALKTAIDLINKAAESIKQSQALYNESLPLAEAVDGTENPEDKDLYSNIISKFMKGGYGVFSGEGEPEETYIPLKELDYENGNVAYKYYYDPEADEVVCYTSVKE